MRSMSLSISSSSVPSAAISSIFCCMSSSKKSPIFEHAAQRLAQIVEGVIQILKVSSRDRGSRSRADSRRAPGAGLEIDLGGQIAGVFGVVNALHGSSVEGILRSLQDGDLRSVTSLSSRPTVRSAVQAVAACQRFPFFVLDFQTRARSGLRCGCFFCAAKPRSSLRLSLRCATRPSSRNSAAATTLGAASELLDAQRARASR